MINMLRKGIKLSIQRVYFPQSYFESRHYGKRFNSIGKFKSLTFQLRAIYFHTFAVDMSVRLGIVYTFEFDFEIANVMLLLLVLYLYYNSVSNTINYCIKIKFSNIITSLVITDLD